MCKLADSDAVFYLLRILRTDERSPQPQRALSNVHAQCSYAIREASIDQLGASFARSRAQTQKNCNFLLFTPKRSVLKSPAYHR